MILLILFFSVFSIAVATDLECGDPAIGPVLGGVDFVEFRLHFQKTGSLSRPMKGSDQFVAKLDSYQFWFQSKENAEMFIRDPAAFYPKYGAYCAWGLTGYDSHATDPPG